MHRLALAILALSFAAPAAAQEWLVNRERFRYIGTRLTIDVVTEGPGRLHVIRGQDGWLGVAGRAPAGFAAAGLTDDDHLTLSAAGYGPVDYMVTVPEGVWIVVRLPDRSNTESVGGHTRLRTFDWSEPARSMAMARGEAPLLPTEEIAAGLFTTYTAELAPASIALPDLRAIRSISVRTGADRFAVATSRPLTLQPGEPSDLVIRPVGEPMDIVIEIPAGTAALSLSAGGTTALNIADTVLVPRCGPFTRQWLSGGREWVTFTPVDGRLECAPTPNAATRHSG